MNEPLFYHFWSLASDSSPFDLNTDYSTSTVRNDKKFIQEFCDFRDYVKFNSHEEYALKLLKIFLDINYDTNTENSKLQNSLNAIAWILHTQDILLNNNIDAEFLSNSSFSKEIEEFKHSVILSISTEQDGKKIKLLYNRSETIFKNLIIQEQIEDNLLDTVPVRNNKAKQYTMKTKVVAILVLLKKLNAGKGIKDYTKISELISLLTGLDAKYISNKTGSQFKLTDAQDDEIPILNEIFKNLGIDFSVNKKDTY